MWNIRIAPDYSFFILRTTSLMLKYSARWVWSYEQKLLQIQRVCIKWRADWHVFKWIITNKFRVMKCHLNPLKWCNRSSILFYSRNLSCSDFQIIWWKTEIIQAFLVVWEDKQIYRCQSTAINVTRVLPPTLPLQKDRWTNFINKFSIVNSSISGLS